MDCHLIKPCGKRISKECLDNEPKAVKTNHNKLKPAKTSQNQSKLAKKYFPGYHFMLFIKGGVPAYFPYEKHFALKKFDKATKRKTIEGLKI